MADKEEKGLKGETSVQSTAIGILAFAAVMTGIGVFFSGFLDSYGQDPENDYEFTSQRSNVTKVTGNITDTFVSKDPNLNLASVFDLVVIFGFTFTNSILQLPGTINSIISGISNDLGVPVPEWFFMFLILSVSTFFAFKVARVLFRKESDI